MLNSIITPPVSGIFELWIFLKLSGLSYRLRKFAILILLLKINRLNIITKIMNSDIVYLFIHIGNIDNLNSKIYPS